MAKKKNTETSRRVTPAMIAGARPASFTGLMFDETTGKLIYACWPGVRFGGERSVVILERTQCESKHAAVALAKRLLSERKVRATP